MNALEKLMEYETAGDPMTDLKWTRKTTEKIAIQLTGRGFPISPNTAARLLYSKKFSLRVNSKKIAYGSSPDRDGQFLYIRSQRQLFTNNGNPIISVDTKKKELVGRFKNAGEVWSDTSTPVFDHDFRSYADGFAIPYGLYDPHNNLGAVFVGTSHDTPAFAVDAVVSWWTSQGQALYPGKSELLILADGGGSNGSRTRAWKYFLQEKLCNGLGLTVTVSHYPPGASKWNPIEHRLFSQITTRHSRNQTSKDEPQNVE